MVINKKAQSTIIGFVLIVAMAIIIISLTFFWARPLIERTQDQQEVMRLEQKMFELHNAIKKVASERGTISIPFDIKRGVIALNNINNTINYQGQFNIQTPVSKKLVFGNNSAPGNFTTLTAEEIVPLGVEEPAYMYEQGAVEFNLHYRVVKDANTNNCYRIKLAPGQQAAAGVGNHIIKLTWLTENTTKDNTLFSNCSNNQTLDQIVEFDIL
jgi:hypothetical protein